MTVRELFKAQGLPVLQNRVYKTRDEARVVPVGDVVLVQDSRTDLIFNRDFDPSMLVYDENYENEQAWSPAFQRHLAEVLTLIGRHFTGKKILEVGCGKGYLPELLRAAGFAATGVDPAFEGGRPYVVKAIRSRAGLVR